MKYKIVFLISICFFYINGCGLNTSKHKLERIKEFGPLKVGDKIPGFNGLSKKGIDFTPASPHGKFHVFFINSKLEPSLLNKEFGPKSQIVINKGGHLKGGSDGKLAKLFGVRLISTSPWEFDTSLIVVADAETKIIAIYKNASLNYLNNILKELKL